MVKDSVYLETSLVSYITARPSRDIIAAAHQTITLDWWDNHRQHFELFISQVVVDEAKLGNPEAAAKRLKILESIAHLEISEEVVNFGQTLINYGIIPQQSQEDALHVAVSCINGMNYLFTWNCKHIANAKKRGEMALCGIWRFLSDYLYARRIIVRRVNMWNDPILEELYKHRQEMAAKFNYDFRALCNYYRERQKLEKHELVSLPPKLLKDLPPIAQGG